MYDALTGTETGRIIKPYVEALTREDEVALFKKYRENMSPELLHEITTTYSPIVRKAVNNMSGYRIDPEELAGEGLVALTDAAQRFDPDLGYRFATFAKKWVRGLMFVYITRNVLPTSISKERDAKNLFFKLKQFIVVNTDKDGEFKLSGAMALKLSEIYNVPVSEIQRMNSLLIKPNDYFSEMIPHRESGEAGHFTVEDSLASSSDTFESIQKYETHEFQTRIIQDAMDQVLDEREAAVYYAQVMCERHDDGFKTLDALAEDWDVSKERIRQVRILAKRKMESRLRMEAALHNWGPEDLFA